MLGGSGGDGERWFAVVLLSLILLGAAGSASAQNGERGRATLVFESQTTDGTTVEIAWLNSTHGGFVVLYEEAFLQGEVFESLIGATSYLEPGAHENVTASFHEPLERTQDVVAVFHKDTNGNRSLDVEETRGAEDGPYQGATGAVFNVAEVTVEQERQSPGPGAIGALLAVGMAGWAATREFRRR